MRHFHSEVSAIYYYNSLKSFRLAFAVPSIYYILDWCILSQHVRNTEQNFPYKNKDSRHCLDVLEMTWSDQVFKETDTTEIINSLITINNKNNNKLWCPSGELNFILRFLTKQIKTKLYFLFTFPGDTALVIFLPHYHLCTYSVLFIIFPTNCFLSIKIA